MSNLVPIEWLITLSGMLLVIAAFIALCRANELAARLAVAEERNTYLIAIAP